VTGTRSSESLTVFGGKDYVPENVNYRGGNFALPANATEVERAKYQLCQLIGKYQRERGLLQREVAEKLGVDESRISDILLGKIESFTLDRLIGYAGKLHPRLRVQINAA